MEGDINKGPWRGCSAGLLFLARTLSQGPHPPVPSHSEPEKGALSEVANGFQISERAFDYPGEPLRGLQSFAAERIEGRWGRNFPIILAFLSPLLECSYSISAEHGEKWGEASFPSAPLNSVAEE